MTLFSVIRSNQRKSAVLLLLMGGVLVGTGYALGNAVSLEGGPVGVAIALAFWLILLLVSFVGGESMLMAQAGGRPIEKRDAPQLYNLVEEMQIASGLSATPKIYLIDTPVPNAFAVGRNERRAAVGFTTGLLAKLNRDELQGVVAHEIAHIRNRDTLFMTLAGTTLGAIILLADAFVRGIRFSTVGRRRSRKGDSGLAVLMLIALVVSILAPLLAQILYFACSRRREYLADACAAQYTRYPEGLASALEKIAGLQRGGPVNRVLAPMYIVPPSAAHGFSAGLFSTHPPTEDRIRILRAMGKSASLRAYEEAYRRLHGGARVLGTAAAPGPDTPTRESLSDASTSAARWRSARSALRSAEGDRTVRCACGVTLRVPSDWAGAAIKCPRCGHRHVV